MEQLVQKITFFLTARDLRDVIEDGNIHGVHLELAVDDSGKVLIVVTGIKRDGGTAVPTATSKVAIPTPPGGTLDLIGEGQTFNELWGD